MILTALKQLLSRNFLIRRFLVRIFQEDVREKIPVVRDLRRSVTKIERLTIAGPVGDLEAMLEWDPERPARLAAVVCHPHPRYGGTMHNKVVFRAAKAAVDVAAPTLRFNFRGVGLSQGKFEDGMGERDDARAALDYLANRFPALPVCMMGFSFGSVVGLAVGAEDDRVKCLVGMGLPVKFSDFSFLRGVRKPKLIVQGTQDGFGPLQQLKEIYSSFAEPKQLHLVENTGHFFLGKLPELQCTIQKFLREILDGTE